MLGEPLPCLLAAGLGLVGGVVDLLSREGWPHREIMCWPTGVYILVNAVASAIALLIANFAQASFFGFGPQTPEANWIRAVVAGLAAVTVIRASIGRHSDPTQTIVRLTHGFDTLMEIALAELDDRRSRARGAPGVAGLMRRVSFTKASVLLPGALYFDVKDEAKHGRAVEEIATINKMARSASDKVKAVLLGTALARIYTEDDLRGAVRYLGDDIREGGRLGT